MKNKIIAILLMVMACINNIHAQQEIQAGSKTYSEVFDSIATGLIPSRIPFGILMDRTFMWSGLSQWEIDDTTNIGHLYQTWYDAEKAVINPINRPSRYVNMRNHIQTQIYEVKLPLMAINYKFAYFDTRALQDGRLNNNNGILTDNNIASPYITKQIGIVGVALDIMQVNKTYALVYDTALLLNNTGSYILNVTATNITTGQVITILPNSVEQTIMFCQVGKNVLKFTMNLNDGNSFSNYQTVTVQGSSSVVGNILYRPNGITCKPYQ